MASTLPPAPGTVVGDVAILHHDLRASDHDREQAVALLKAHYADGRLSASELAWRSDTAYRAVGVGELRRLTSDLPAPARPRRPRRSPALPLSLLAFVLAAWLVTVPPEVTLALLADLLGACSARRLPARARVDPAAAGVRRLPADPRARELALATEQASRHKGVRRTVPRLEGWPFWTEPPASGSMHPSS